MKHLRRIGIYSGEPQYLCIKKSVIIIGRDTDQADLNLENKETKSYISRLHARIVAFNNNYKIFDDSRNGIFINNIKISNEALLNEGDLVIFGHPFGENIKSGERVRQPNSEYQYIFESCQHNVQSPIKPQDNSLNSWITSMSRNKKNDYLTQNILKEDIKNINYELYTNNFLSQSIISNNLKANNSTSDDNVSSKVIENNDFMIHHGNNDFMTHHENNDFMTHHGNNDFMIDDDSERDIIIELLIKSILEKVVLNRDDNLQEFTKDVSLEVPDYSVSPISNKIYHKNEVENLSEQNNFVIINDQPLNIEPKELINNDIPIINIKDTTSLIQKQQEENLLDYQQMSSHKRKNVETDSENKIKKCKLENVEIIHLSKDNQEYEFEINNIIINTDTEFNNTNKLIAFEDKDSINNKLIENIIIDNLNENTECSDLSDRTNSPDIDENLLENYEIKNSTNVTNNITLSISNSNDMTTIKYSQNTLPGKDNKYNPINSNIDDYKEAMHIYPHNADKILSKENLSSPTLNNLVDEISVYQENNTGQLSTELKFQNDVLDGNNSINEKYVSGESKINQLNNSDEDIKSPEWKIEFKNNEIEEVENSNLQEMNSLDCHVLNSNITDSKLNKLRTNIQYTKAEANETLNEAIFNCHKSQMNPDNLDEQSLNFKFPNENNQINCLNEKEIEKINCSEIASSNLEILLNDNELHR